MNMSLMTAQLISHVCNENIADVKSTLDDLRRIPADEQTLTVKAQILRLQMLVDHWAVDKNHSCNDADPKPNEINTNGGW
jgi:hypothetical protein